MERIGIIFAVAQFALFTTAYILAGLFAAVHIISGNIDTVSGYALSLGVVLCLRWCVKKSYDEIERARKE